jgi:hypothetical protein
MNTNNGASFRFSIEVNESDLEYCGTSDPEVFAEKLFHFLFQIKQLEPDQVPNPITSSWLRGEVPSQGLAS